MSEEMRKDFSKEYYHLSGCEVLFDDYGTPYIGGISEVIANTSVQSAWWGWKKSREAMKPIKLPDTDEFEQEYWWIGDDLQGDEQCMIIPDIERYADAISEAIQQAGYKVAE